MREGDFNIDDTRVRKSDDSGCPDDGAANSNSVSSSSSTSNVSTSLDIQDLASNGQKNSVNKDTSRKRLISTSKEEANLSKNSDINSSAELHHVTTTHTGIKVVRVIKSDASDGLSSGLSSNPVVKKKIDLGKTEEACQDQVQNSVKATVVLVRPPKDNAIPSVKPKLNPSCGAESGAKNTSADIVPLKLSEYANEDALPVAPPRRNGSFREKTQRTSNKSIETLNIAQSEVDGRNVTRCQTKDSAQTKGTDSKTQVMNLTKHDQSAVPVVPTDGGASIGNSTFHRPGRSASCGPGNSGTAENNAVKKTALQATTTQKQSRFDKKVNSTVPLTGKLDGSSPSLGTEEEIQSVSGKATKVPAKKSEVNADSSVRRVIFSPVVGGSFQPTSARNVSVDMASSFDNSSSPADNVDFLIPRRSASFRHGTSRDANRPGGSEMFIRRDLRTDLNAKTGDVVLPRPVIPEKQSLHIKAAIPKGNEIPLPPQSQYSTHPRVPGNHSAYQQSEKQPSPQKSSSSEIRSSSQKSSTSENRSSSQKLTASESQSSSSSSSQKPSYATENLVSFNKSYTHTNQTSVQKLVRTHLRTTTATDAKASPSLAVIGADRKASGDSVRVSSSRQVAYVSAAGEGSQKLPVQSKAAIVIKQIRSKLGPGELQKFTAQKISNSLDKCADVDVPKNVKVVASSGSKYIPINDDISSHKSMAPPCGAEMDDSVNKQESISVLPEDGNGRSIDLPDECPAVSVASPKGNEDLEECSRQSGAMQAGSKAVPSSVSIVTARPAQVIHTGPVICDPFESLKLRQESAMAAAKIIPSNIQDNCKPHPAPKSAKQRAQIVSSAKSRHEVRPQPKKARQPSTPLSAFTARAKSKTKSGRRERNRRKSKRNCTELIAAETSREEEFLNGPDVKLIGGIGWHVAARPADAMTREENMETLTLLHDSGDYDSPETVRSSSRSTGRSLEESSHSEDSNQSAIREQDKGNVSSLLETGTAGQHAKSSSHRKVVSGRKGVAITGVQRLTTSLFEQRADNSSLSERDTHQQLEERLIPDAATSPKETKGFRSSRGSGSKFPRSEPVGNAALLKLVEEGEEEVTVRVVPVSPRDDDGSMGDHPMTEAGRSGAAGEYNANLEELIREILDTTLNPSLSSSARSRRKAKQKEDNIHNWNNQGGSSISSHRAAAPNLSDTLKSDKLSRDIDLQSERDDVFSHLYESIITGKPPMPGKSSLTSSVADQSFQALERSPRFVRKHDSCTLLHRANNPSSSEDENAQTKAMDAVISTLQQPDDSLLSTDQVFESHKLNKNSVTETFL